MLSEYLQKLLTSLKETSAAVKQLSSKRLGFKSPEDLKRAVDDLNRRIAAHGGEATEKLALMRHEVIRQELAALKGVLLQVVPLFQDRRVLEQWTLRVDPATVRRHTDNALAWLDKFKSDVDEHEELVRAGVTNEQTAKLEYNIITRYEPYKTRLIMAIDDTVNQIETAYRAEPTRRDILGRLAAGFIMGAAGMGSAVAQEVANVASDEKKVTPEDIITLEEITKLEEKKKPRDILNDNTVIKSQAVQFVTYDKETGQNNYADLISSGSGKYIVLFGSSNSSTATAYTKRRAIQLKAISRHLGDEVTLIYFDMDIDPKLAADNYAGFKTFQIKYQPSIEIVTYDKDKKTTKIVDVDGGGMETGKAIRTSAYNSIIYWINPLILDKPSPTGKIYKFENSARLHAVDKK